MLMNRPEASASLSELWGLRWNLMVQEMLAREVYYPLRDFGISKPLAVMSTFGASGFLHAYPILFTLPAANSGVSVLWDAVSVLSFFFIQGSLVLVEKILFTPSAKPPVTSSTMEVPATRPRLMKRAWIYFAIFLPLSLLLDPMKRAWQLHQLHND